MVSYVVFCPADPSSDPVLVIFCCVFPSHKNVRHFSLLLNKFNHKLSPIVRAKVRTS